MNSTDGSKNSAKDLVAETHLNNLVTGRSHYIDRVFPLYDQIMQHVKLPNLFSTACDVFISFQVLAIGFWVYSPPFQRCTGKWRSVYEWILRLTAFQNPLDFESTHLINSYVCLIVTLLSIGWLVSMILYNRSFFMIPTILLYISVFILDLIAPIFIVPSAYCAAHGIAGLHYKHDGAFTTEIVLGLISFVSSLFFFTIGILLKSRSVIFTNLTFQCYDMTTILSWFSITSVCCLVSGLFVIYDGWFYLFIILIHICCSFFVCYRIMFIPFYTLWRNPICFQFGMVTIVLDLNLFYLYIFNKSTYNYTIIILLVVTILAHPVGQIVFGQLVKKTKEQLTYDEDITNKTEYFDELGICKNTLWATRFIVVGLSELCDYFVDGSITEYIINHVESEGILSLLLQIVTYFPSESQKLSILYKRLISMRKLTFINRFLIYQISKIKTRRLTSNTKDTTDLYNRLHSLNEEVKATIRSFWDRPSDGHSFVEMLSYRTKKLNRYFQYFLESNPNNIKITTEYTNFLVECLCDFDGAIIQTMRADQILDGRDFNIDISYRSLIQKFPRYLKDGLFDTKGRKTISENTSSSNQSRLQRRQSFADLINIGNQQEVMDSILNPANNNSGKNSVSKYDQINNREDIDLESEEMIGSRILKESRVRLALNHTLSNLKPIHSSYIAVFAVFSFAIHSFFIIFFYSHSKQKVSWRRNAYEDLMYSGGSIFYGNYASYYLWLNWANYTGRYNTNSETLKKEIALDESFGMTKIIDKKLNDLQSSLYLVNFSASYLHLVLDSISNLPGTVNVYKVATSLLSTTSTIQECSNGKPNKNVTASLADQLSFMYYEQRTIAGNFNEGTYPENIYTEENNCEVIKNYHVMNKNAKEVFDSLLQYNIERSEKYVPEFKLWLIIGLIVILFVTILPINADIIVYRKMVNEFCKILLNLPPKIKEEAKNPLMDEIAMDSSNTGAVAKKVAQIKLIFIVFLSYLLIFLLFASFAALCVTTMKSTENSSILLKWYFYSVERMVLASEIGNNIIHLIIMNSSLPNDTLSRFRLINRTESLIENLKESHEILMNGDSDTPKSIGYDSELDKLQIGSPCNLSYDPVSFHDMYVCSSVNSQIGTFLSLVTDIIKSPETYQGNLNSEVAMNLLHILEYHLYPNIVDVTHLISNLMTKKFDQERDIRVTFLLIGFADAVLIFFLSFTYKTLMDGNYKMVLVLIQHLNPSVICNNNEILAFLHRHHHQNNKSEEMPISKSIVYGASEMIIITNQNSVVEIINPSVTDNLGLKPDQMLGQQITNFVSINDQKQIKSQIELMASGQGSLVWQDHIELINELGKSVPFAVTMIGMKDNDNSSEINSIVFILNNESEEIKKRTAAENAKQRSEKLLYQILPKDIVIRLNRGEKDISFTIPKATIFFIDIVKFSAYSSSLTPGEIMSNLSLVFSSFDKIVSKYDQITKIKLIGDVYMAAAGLFQSAENNDHKKHAMQSVKCCLDVQRIMDDINTKLESSLEVRIGINTGGPLIGGVLGTDKPTFDIIGDPINIASRLQSTDIPGRVQISQETKEMIADMDFIIEERGEVYLKGKGNRTTYFVRYPNKDLATESFAMNMFSGKL